MTAARAGTHATARTAAGLAMLAAWVHLMDPTALQAWMIYTGLGTTAAAGLLVAVLPEPGAPPRYLWGRKLAWWFGMTREWWTPQLIVLRLIAALVAGILIFG